MLSRFVKFRKGENYEDLSGDVQIPSEKGNGELELPPTVAQDENVTISKSFSNDSYTETYTIQQAIDRLGFGKFQVKLSILTGFAWMADAMEMMILSILAPALHCSWNLSGIKQALLTTVVFCGMMASSGLWGSICDKYGRKVELIMSSLFTCYFGFLSAFSPTFIWILVLRCLVGFGVGGAPQAVTLYAEFLPSSSRARCVVLIEIFWAIGACFEVLLALLVMPYLGWRWLLGLSALPLLIFSACCSWLPESARYDVTRGNIEKAQATIERIAKENGKPMLLGKLQETNLQTENVKRGSLLDTLKSDFRITTILLWVIWLVNAFSYYGIVLMTTELFQYGGICPLSNDKMVANANPVCSLECKMLSTKDYVDLLWTTCAEFPGLIITVLVIDRIGRKYTILIEFFIFSVFTLFLNICTTRPILIVLLFIARAFISGAFQGAYVYTPEVYPTSMRAIGLGACSAMARIGAIITPFVSQVLLKISGHLAVSIYGVLGLLGGLAAFLLPIETKGREMTDISLSQARSLH